MVEFRDATENAPPDLHFPYYVQAFQDLRFVRLGRMARVMVAGLDEIARYYPEPHRDAFIQMKAIPQTVLAAPDGSAFVLVDWWWGNPEVRLRTVLSTGAVVETRRSWDVPPVWLSRDRWTKRFVLGDEQRRSAARGRDIRVVAGSPAALWRAHQMHVDEYRQKNGGKPIADLEMVGALNLSSRLAAHDVRVTFRTAFA